MDKNTAGSEPESTIDSGASSERAATVPPKRSHNVSERLGLFVAPAPTGEPDADEDAAAEAFRSNLSRQTGKETGALSKRLVGDEEPEASQPTTEYRGNPFMKRMMEQRRRSSAALGRRS